MNEIAGVRACLGLSWPGIAEVLKSPLPEPFISAPGRGVLAFATMPNGCKLRPSFTPSVSSHDVKERRNGRGIP